MATQMNLLDWFEETMSKIHDISKANCRWINAAIDAYAKSCDEKLRCISGQVDDVKAEQIIYTAANLRNEHCRRLHKKRKALIWNSEPIEA